MTNNTRKYFAALAAVCTGLFGLAGRAQASDTVHAGWNLFHAPEGTTFAGVPFKGVPLQTFDFGGSIGVKNVGNTDTIIERPLSIGGQRPITGPIILTALQLETTAPVDLGAGLGSYFITLQSLRGGPVSTGQMTIDFGPEGNPHGTFTGSLDIFFDVRFAILDGPIVESNQLTLFTQGSPWSHDPEGLKIADVNHNLDGQDIYYDYWPGKFVLEQGPNGLEFRLTSAVPEASTYFAAFMTFGVMVGSMAIRRSRAQS